MPVDRLPEPGAPELVEVVLLAVPPGALVAVLPVALPVVAVLAVLAVAGAGAAASGACVRWVLGAGSAGQSLPSRKGGGPVRLHWPPAPALEPLNPPRQGAQRGATELAPSTLWATRWWIHSTSG